MIVRLLEPDQETKNLLSKFNRESDEAREKIGKLTKIMADITVGNCPLYPCYVDKEHYVSVKKYTNGHSK